MSRLDTDIAPKDPDQIERKERCRYCRSEIEFGAKICPVCKSYQSTTKNILSYIAPLAGLITIIVSGATFTFLNIGGYLKERNALDRLTVIYMIYPGLTGENKSGEMLFSNNGDNDLFVLGISLEYGFEGSYGNYRIPLQKEMKSNTISMFEAKDFTYKDLTAQFFEPLEITPYNLSNSTGTASKALTNEALRLGKKCVYPRLITKNHPDFSRMETFYQKYNKHLSK